MLGNQPCNGEEEEYTFIFITTTYARYGASVDMAGPGHVSGNRPCNGKANCTKYIENHFPWPSCHIVRYGLPPHPRPETAMDEILVECIYVTSLNNVNKEAIWDRRANVVVMQEHEMTTGVAKKVTYY